jgi:hypothetical protein
MDRRNFVNAAFLGLGAVGVSAATKPSRAKADFAERQVCVVADFGARGDGRTTGVDGGAIQAALDAVWPDGGTVHVPAGTYLLECPLRIHSKTHLCLAQGAVLRRNFNAAVEKARNSDKEPHRVIMSTDVNADGVLITGGTFDANGLVFTHGCVAFVGVGVTNLRIEGTKFLDAHYHALDLARFNNVFVRDCQFLGQAPASDAGDFREAIQLDPDVLEGSGSSSYGISVDNCIFARSHGCPAWPCGIGNHHQPENKHHYDVKITRCTFLGMRYSAIRGLAFNRAIIANNEFDGSPEGPRAHAIYLSNARDVVIANNNAKAVKGTFVNILNSSGVNVVGNNVASAAENGVWVSGSDSRDITITSNIFRRLNFRGVHLDNGVHHASVLGNTIIDANLSGGGRPAIAAEGQCHDFVITGNTIITPATGVLVSNCYRYSDAGNVQLS